VYGPVYSYITAMVGKNGLMIHGMQKYWSVKNSHQWQKQDIKTRQISHILSRWCQCMHTFIVNFLIWDALTLP